jgi:CRISPR-associated exonuclease Cas4
MAELLPVLLAGILLVAAALWVLSRRTRAATGLPQGQVVYVDTRGWQKSDRPLFSNTYRLIGKPDYLAKDGRNLIPVEVKSRAAPAAPYLSHVMQLATYCLLVEDVLSEPAPYGYIHYRDKTFRVDFTPSLRAELLKLLAEMRAAGRARQVHRSHDTPQRCAHCGFEAVCGEQLSISA